MDPCVGVYKQLAVEVSCGVKQCDCPNFAVSGCHSKFQLDICSSRGGGAVLGQGSMHGAANVAYFGKDPCTGTPKQLAVRVQCTGITNAH
jgi:hypothetical protein